MKTTPPARAAVALLAAALAAGSLLAPGCGHTREAVYPGRKVAPPRFPKSRAFAQKWRRPAPPLAPAAPPVVVRPAEPAPPTVIDVPALDRNGP